MPEASQDELNKIADDIATLWVEDEIIEAHSLPANLLRKTANHKEAPVVSWDTWDDFGGVDNPKIGKSVDLLNDPEVLNELAKRDPNFKAQLDEQRIEEVSLTFTRQNPTYRATAANLQTILKYIAKKYLNAPNLDEDAVIDEAYKAGYWTLETLNTVFKTLAKQGRLEVEPGKIKELSKDDQLDIIAQIRMGDPGGAALTYIHRSYGGDAPEFTSVADFLARNPKLATEASKFVFYHSKATIPDDQWRQFEKEKLAGRPMLTFEVISDAWDDWTNSRPRLSISPKVPKDEPEPAPVTRADLENLSDEEIDALRVKTLREMYRR